MLIIIFLISLSGLILALTRTHRKKFHQIRLLFVPRVILISTFVTLDGLLLRQPFARNLSSLGGGWMAFSVLGGISLVLAVMVYFAVGRRNEGRGEMVRHVRNDPTVMTVQALLVCAGCAIFLLSPPGIGNVSAPWLDAFLHAVVLTSALVLAVLWGLSLWRCDGGGLDIAEDSHPANVFELPDAGIDPILANLAHEMRTPLASSLLMIDRLQREAGSAERCDEQFALQTISSTLTEVSNLIEYFSGFGRGGWTGGSGNSFSLVDISRIAREQVSNIAAFADLKDIQITVTIPHGTVLCVDRTLIGRVFHNLISNSVKFCRDGCSIHVGSHGESGFFVEDNGSGVPEEQLKLLFDQQQITPGSATLGERGSGMGLQTCKAIISSHNGHIFAVNREPGLRIEFDLSGARPQILLICENDHFAKNVERSLQGLFNTSVLQRLRSRADALAFLHLQSLRSAPDLIVLESVGRSEFEGILDFVRAIRSSSLMGDRGALIVGLPETARIPDDVRRRCIMAGADDVFSGLPDLSVMRALLLGAEAQ